jgi:hypothetical protein
MDTSLGPKFSQLFFLRDSPRSGIVEYASVRVRNAGLKKKYPYFSWAIEALKQPTRNIYRSRCSWIIPHLVFDTSHLLISTCQYVMAAGVVLNAIEG